MGSAVDSAVGPSSRLAACSMWYCVSPGAAGAGKPEAGTWPYGRVLFVLIAVLNVCRGAAHSLCEGSASSIRLQSLGGAILRAGTGARAALDRCGKTPLRRNAIDTIVRGPRRSSAACRLTSAPRHKPPLRGAPRVRRRRGALASATKPREAAPPHPYNLGGAAPQNSKKDGRRQGRHRLARPGR